MAPGGLARWLRALVEAAHPFPIAAVLAFTTLVAVASALDLDGFDWHDLGLVLLAMLLSQLSIGWTNDYVDRGVDAVYRQKTKPVASGRLDASQLPVLAVLAALSSITLVFLSFSTLTLVWFLIGTGAGLLYDLKLKDTRLSWLPYVVALVVLPPYVWSAMDSFLGEFLLLYPVALPLALAVHVANALPDIDSDQASGRRGIVATIGRGTALALLFVTLETPVILALTSLVWLSPGVLLFAGTLVAYVAIELLAARLYFVRPFEKGARLAFRPLVSGAILFVAGLLASL